MVGTVTFTWARKMAKIMNFDRELFFIHALELKLRLLECFPYVCIGKPAMDLQCFTYGVRYLETCSYGLHACIVWLYCMSRCTGQFFFLLSVWSPCYTLSYMPSNNLLFCGYEVIIV